jgi:hydroxyacylglutathione hydrolase
MLFANKAKVLKPEEAAAGLAQGNLTLVDVRGVDERAEGYVAGSLHIPLDELPGRLGELPSGQPWRSSAGREPAARAGRASRRSTGPKR